MEILNHMKIPGFAPLFWVNGLKQLALSLTPEEQQQADNSLPIFPTLRKGKGKCLVLLRFLHMLKIPNAFFSDRFEVMKFQLRSWMVSHPQELSIRKIVIFSSGQVSKRQLHLNKNNLI